MYKPASLYQLLFVILIYCNACTTADETVAGGPCIYKYDSIPARIITVDSINSNRLNLILVLENKGVYKTDTIDYYAAFNHHLEPEVIKEKNIAVNDSLLFVSATLVSGACNPTAGTTLLLEHYKK